jgi:hypothetical protein
MDFLLLLEIARSPKKLSLTTDMGMKLLARASR